MRDCLPIALNSLPVPIFWDDPALDERLNVLSAYSSAKIVVLDDDPTGVQTVHDVPVYTNWEEATIREAFAASDRMFFLLMNSRGMTKEETARQHRLIAQRIAQAAQDAQQDYILISRSDSTLRGHYPLETDVLRRETEANSDKRFDGEIIYPFFLEGGRYTYDSVHYVLDGDMLIPCGRTPYAVDKSFGYTASYLPDYLEEKSEGWIRSGDVIRITLEDLRINGTDAALKKLLSAGSFAKIVVDSLCYADVKAFAVAFWQAIQSGKSFLLRSAAAVPKILGNISNIPLLTSADLVPDGCENGGIVIIGSHVPKTTRQLVQLQESGLPVRFVTFNQHRVLEDGGLRDEVERTAAAAAASICQGETVVVFTRRDRIDLPDRDKDMQLKISTEISDALTSVIAGLSVQPRFIVAKGGITSSDVGVKSLRVRKAMVAGQIRPGIPVWKTGPESKFPGLPYIIFPGNVGADDDLRIIVEELIGKTHA